MSWVIWSTMMIIPEPKYDSVESIITEINNWSESVDGISCRAHEGNVKKLVGNKSDCIVFGGGLNYFAESDLKSLTEYLRKKGIAQFVDFVWIDENNLYDCIQYGGFE